MQILFELIIIQCYTTLNSVFTRYVPEKFVYKKFVQTIHYVHTIHKEMKYWFPNPTKNLDLNSCENRIKCKVLYFLRRKI